MKANELRIGNLLQEGLSKVLLLVTGVDDKGFNTIDVDRSTFPLNEGWYAEPILLTEEWLLKFGFQLLTEKRVGTKYSEYGNGEIHHEKRFNLAKHADKDYWYCLRGSVKIQFVHQLQNLYFALTGSELPTDHCKLTTE